MDSLTHIVLGAAIGQAVAGRQAGRHAMIWGALANSAPDIDVLVSFFTNDVGAMVHHRGITHSLITALLAGPLIGYWFYRMNKKKGVTPLRMILLFTIGIVLHDLLDTCTIYGTGLMEPFSSYRFSTDNIFVADPLYTLPLLVSGIVLSFRGHSYKWRRRWNNAGILVSSLYMMMTFVNQHTVKNVLELSLEKKGIKSSNYFVTPTLLNNIAWNAVVKDSSGYWVGYYSLFQKDKEINLNFIPVNDSLLGEMNNNPDVALLKKFSKGFYCITKEQNRFWFNDLRFGQIGGWEREDAPFAFSFDLSVGADNSIVVQRGRLEGSRSKMLGSLWHFMWHGKS